MGVFGEFDYGTGVVYGDTSVTQRAELVANNIVLVYFGTEVLVDDAYRSTSSYSVSLVEGTGDEIAILEVLPVNAHAIDRAYLRTSYHTNGAIYEIVVTGLSTRFGVDLTGSFEFKSRTTKLDLMTRYIPSHFSLEANSLVRNILTAIALSDDQIGGSRDDTLP